MNRLHPLKQNDPLKFTIVTPSLNQESYIGATIESVITQAGDFQIEYFVQDGGSADGSLETIRSYAERIGSGRQGIHCRGITMDWESKPDKGQTEAVNRGLKKAAGDIVAYLNSDDMYFPGTLEGVATVFQSHPEVDFVHGDGEFIDEQGNPKWEWLSRPYDHKVMTSYHYLWNRFTNFIVQPATFWRKEVLDKIGYLDESFHYAMDNEYWVRAGHFGLKFFHIPVKFGKYRLIPGTKSLSSPTVFWEDSLEMYRRYRRPGSLSSLFAFYYYNLILNEGLDLERGKRRGEQVFERWKELPEEEQEHLKSQAEKGWDLTNLLISGVLARLGQKEKAGFPFRQALISHPTLLLHPFAWSYLLRKAAPSSLAFRIETFVERMILFYRDFRYEYRYQEGNTLTRMGKKFRQWTKRKG